MKQRSAVLAFLALLSVITYFDRVCISVAGPMIQDDLGLSSKQWGWVLSAFILAYGLFEIPSGAMGDRHGYRLTLMRIVAWWSVFTSLTAVAHRPVVPSGKTRGRAGGDLVRQPDWRRACSLAHRPADQGDGMAEHISGLRRDRCRLDPRLVRMVS